jgi:long-subunit fatty acid transport protein
MPSLVGRATTLVLFLALGASHSAQAAPIGSIFTTPTGGDANSTFLNPAAMSTIEGTEIAFFASVSLIRAQYSRATPSAYDGQYLDQARLDAPKPDVALSVVTDAGLSELDIWKNFRFGLSATVPLLDGATWPEDSRASYYYAIIGRQVTFMLQPTVGYKINRYISVAVGMDIMAAWLAQEVNLDYGAKINQAGCALNPSAPCDANAPFKREDPSLTGLVEIGGLGWGLGVTGGLLVTPTPWLAFAFSVHSGASISVPVDIELSIPQVATDYVKEHLPTISLPALKAKGIAINVVPTIISAGISIRPLDSLLVSLDMQWIDKSRTSILDVSMQSTTTAMIADQILIKALKDDWLFGITGIYEVIPSLKLALRFEADPNTRPERYYTPVSVDFDKFALSLGIAWQATRWLNLSVEYSHYFIPSKNVEVSNFKPNANPTTPEEDGFDKPLPTGLYSAQTDRFGLSASFSF